jgi:hypothetical protein
LDGSRRAERPAEIRATGVILRCAHDALSGRAARAARIASPSAARTALMIRLGNGHECDGADPVAVVQLPVSGHRHLKARRPVRWGLNGPPGPTRRRQAVEPFRAVLYPPAAMVLLAHEVVELDSPGDSADSSRPTRCASAGVWRSGGDHFTGTAAGEPRPPAGEHAVG